METSYVIGLDFGSDSVRAILVDAHTGEQAAEAVHNYERWGKGLYCNPTVAQFRQHPLDHREGLLSTIKGVLEQRPDLASRVRAIAVDTTASTPVLADRNLTPLALTEKYAECPDAMFVLWKDHTGEREAAEINRACKSAERDYSCFTGYHYSSECFWAKVLHLLRQSEELRKDAYTVIELCDWIPAILTRTTNPADHRQGHCCTAQKMFWSEEWGGFPPREFFEGIDPLLLPILDTLHPAKYTCDKPYGTISKEMAAYFGLPEDVIIGCGNVDSHQGSIGAGVGLGKVTLSLGTSAACMAVMSAESLGGKVIDGVFGQVESCIIPGLVGFEVGMSAFGDVFAWFKRLLSYPLAKLAEDESLSAELREKVLAEQEKILIQLTEDAGRLPLREDAPFATDWLNGRRSPAPNDRLWGSVMGLRLSSSAPEIYYALVEATAFAVRAITDHLQANGMPIDDIIGVGGIAQKSPFVMQMIADVTGKRINVSASKQSAALGSAMCAATVCGIYPSIESAQAAMVQPVLCSYEPRVEVRKHFEKRYALYRAADAFTGNMVKNQ